METIIVCLSQLHLQRVLLQTAPCCELEAALGTVEAVLGGEVAGEVGQGADGQTALRAHLVGGREGECKVKPSFSTSPAPF